jgi:predicted dehydrogenase
MPRMPRMPGADAAFSVAAAGRKPYIVDMNKETAIGVLGVGRMGRIHCEQIAATPGLRLAAASSRSPDRVAAAAEGRQIRTYARHEELLADPEPEWVVIATYTSEHHEWALKAIAAGKNVIVEKPMALSFAEASSIFRAADKQGVRVTVYQNRRWDPDFQLVRRVLEQGLLGEVYRIESRYTIFSSGWGGWGAAGLKNPWRLKKDRGGGMLGDWGPHLFDQLLLLEGSPVRSVLGRLENRIWSSEVEDHFWAEIVFDRGLSARVEASNNHRLPLPRWLLVGKEGTLKVTGGSVENWNNAVLRREDFGYEQEIRFDTKEAGPEAGFYTAFADALARQVPLPVQPSESLAVMKLMDGVRESARRGNSLDLQAFA